MWKRRKRQPVYGICRGCEQHRSLKARQLCYGCYYFSGRREEFSTNCQALADFNGGYRLPARPTTALPGSAEKIAELVSRVERKEQLRHPLDAEIDEVGTPDERAVFLAGSDKNTNGRKAPA